MIITYVVFGADIVNYNQAVFSILSFIGQTNTTHTIVVVTDTPENFNVIANHITIIPVPTETFTQWRGPENFIFRIKIKALELVAQQFKNHHLLYADADTFLHGNLAEINTILENGTNLMHVNEGILATLQTKTLRTLYNHVKNKTYSGITITPTTTMWNAGVVAVSKNNHAAITQALTVCDAMSQGLSRRRLVEQFAFSVTLHTSGSLAPANAHIAHYWGNKTQWTHRINTFLCSSYLQNSSTATLVENVQQIITEKIPVYIKTSNTNQRWKKKLDKFFPDKEHTYINN